MNEHDTDARRRARRPRAPTATAATAVRLDQGHVEGTGRPPRAVREPRPAAARPAWPTSTRRPPSAPRSRSPALRPLDPRHRGLHRGATSRSPMEAQVFIPGIGNASLYNVVLGVTLALALLGIGFGAVHWAKTLMPDKESSRSATRSAPATRTASGVVSTSSTAAARGPARPPPADQVLASAVRSASSPLPLVLQRRRRPRPAARGRAVQDACGRRATAWSATPSARRSRPTDVTHRLGLPRAARVHQGLRARPRGQGQGGRPADAPRPRGHQVARRSATGATTASSPTPRSAPTSAARSACTSSRRTTCCARATSRPST